jgi:hypothetical protein
VLSKNLRLGGLMSLIFATLKWSRGALLSLRDSRTIPGMKTVFDFGGSISRAPIGCGCVTLVCAGLLLVAGCGKSNSSASSPPVVPSADAANASAAASNVSTPTSFASASATNADDSQTEVQTLNRALLGWMIKNRKHPQNFAEFASTANIEIPAPPPGKKYTLNQRGLIILVNNSAQ